MDRLLYISTVGLNNIDQAQAARAHNLANVSTTGFRADLARVMATEVTGDGYQARVYGVNEDAGVDMSQGAHIETGRSLDLAINGDGLLSVLLPNGQEGYTRDGALQIDATGRLLSAEGFEVIGLGGPIALPPIENILIGADGTLTVRPEGQGADSLVQIDQLKLVNPAAGELTKDPSGFLVPKLAGALPADLNVTVTSGFLESSNVNAVNELTGILALSRQYELEVRMMRIAEENDEAASQLLRIG
jgi:flagellar basal-body rod protein FlgF